MKKFWIILFGLIAFLNLKVEAFTNDQTDSIQENIRKFKYREALLLIDNAIEKDSTSKELFLLKGSILRGIYEYDNAIKSFQKALALDTTDNRSLIEIATTYKLVPDYEMALTFFSKALMNDTTNVQLQIECANCKFLNEQYAQSNADFRKIYQNDTTNYFAIKRLAFGMSKVDQNDSSVYFYRKAIGINPTDASNITRLSNLLISQDKYKEGIELTEGYRSLDSANARVNSVNAYLYLLNKQYDTAIVRFNNCVALHDTTFFVLKNLGISYFKYEKYDTAMYWLEKAYQIDTTDVLNLQFLGIACSQAFYKKKSIFYLEKALQQYDPFLKDYAAIYRNLVETYRTWGLTPCEKNLEISLNAYNYNPNDSMLALYIALGYDDCKKNYRKAIEYYNIYLKTKPKNMDPHLQITMSYVMFENRVKVLRDYLRNKK